MASRIKGITVEIGGDTSGLEKSLSTQHIIKDILKLNINYMLHEDCGHYSYTEHYSLGDIFIYTSADEEKGVLWSGRSKWQTVLSVK